MVKLSQDYQVIDTVNGGVIDSPLKIISNTHLSRLERQDAKMTTALISMLSNYLGRNILEVEIFRAELDRAIELYDERPQLLIA